MQLIILVAGVLLALMALTSAFQAPNKTLRLGSIVGAVVILIITVPLSSVHFVGGDELGLIQKNAMGAKLAPGKIIATNGEMGPQAQVLPPGWHFGYWPVLYTVRNEKILSIPEGKVGVLTTFDGLPLPAGQAFANEWDENEVQKMVEDAAYFLTDGKGYKGPQASVLTPGKYRMNPMVFKIDMEAMTNIPPASVAVIKSNVGDIPTEMSADGLVESGQRGIWRQPYGPSRLYLNTRAYEVTLISTEAETVFYGVGGTKDESVITVRTSDGFEFPVDVRVEYRVMPADAPLVVKEFGGDERKMKSRLSSAVRAIFRNNAEKVKALDYVKQRSQQEDTTTQILAPELEKIGITINRVRIGQVETEKGLGDLLKTQTDREIAIQQQITLEEQVRAEEQNKELLRTEQEAEEEKRLATARYGVQIAEEEKAKLIIEANAEAEAIRIKAEAQAEAYRAIAMEIGKGNAALVELLRIIGENGINITPRVMVIGGDGGGSGDAETTALIGTMLDTMTQSSTEN